MAPARRNAAQGTARSCAAWQAADVASIGRQRREDRRFAHSGVLVIATAVAIANKRMRTVRG
jgi:hypothetical protein